MDFSQTLLYYVLHSHQKEKEYYESKALQPNNNYYLIVPNLFCL